MENKMGMRLIFFFIGWDIFDELQGLKEKKKDEFIANEKYNHQDTL